MDPNERYFPYYKKYPKILFYRPEYGNGRPVRGMHFVLSLHKSHKRAEYEEMVEKMKYCGGICTYNIEDVNEHSVIIVDHQELVSESIPAFRVEYIIDCLDMGKCIDIEFYRQERSKGIRRDLSDRPNGIMDVVYFYSKCWDLPVANIVNIESNSDNELTDNMPPLEITPKIEEVASESSTTSERLKSTPKTKEAKPKSPTTTEQVCWHTEQKAENNPKLPARTGEEDSGDEQVSSTSSTKTKDSPMSGCRTTTNRDQVSDIGWIQPHTAPPPKKRGHRNYTDEDREVIVRYIVGHKEYERVKGRELWQIMERKQILPHRTWQSMKEHFIKKIVLDLDTMPFLTNEQKRQIKRPLKSMLI